MCFDFPSRPFETIKKIRHRNIRTWTAANRKINWAACFGILCKLFKYIKLIPFLNRRHINNHSSAVVAGFKKKNNLVFPLTNYRLFPRREFPNYHEIGQLVSPPLFSSRHDSLTQESACARVFIFEVNTHKATTNLILISCSEPQTISSSDSTKSAFRIRSSGVFGFFQTANISLWNWRRHFLFQWLMWFSNGSTFDMLFVPLLNLHQG